MDLTTKYLGLDLKNPIVPSAGPLTDKVDKIKTLEDAGAAAVVLYSLFEEEIEHDQLELYNRTTSTQEIYSESVDFFPEPFVYKTGPEEYLNHIQKTKSAVDIPVIASLNGKSLGGWIEYAKKIEQAGADALELNIYMLATDPQKPSGEIEKLYIDIVKEVKLNVNIPIAIKMHPFFSSVSKMADEFVNVGADGLVLFNRFYQPDIDLEKLEVVPTVLLSTPMDMRLPLRWIGILYGKIKADLAATSGISNEKDALKMIMAGANVVQMLSSLLKFGANHISEVLTNMVYWMEINEYESLNQMRGSMSHLNTADPSQFERANYMKMLHSYK